MLIVDASTIRAAHPRIPVPFRGSPQFVSEALSQQLGRPVIVKLEVANPIGCFKGRGTWLAMTKLLAGGQVGERGGIVTASAGNFGQGVAYAGRELGIPVVVYAATTANPSKVAAMRRLSAEVRLVGEDFDEAVAAASRAATEDGWRLLVDGQDPWIAIGAGTIALELTDGVAAGGLPALEAVYVPVGNGALIGGVGAWFKEVAPEVRVIGVQAERAPAMERSWRARRPIETERADTIADGIAARVPVPEALELMLAFVDEMVLVSEEEIIEATRELEVAVPVAIETAAGAGWAAARRSGASRGPITLIVTGGNTDRG